jgi:sigma-70 region 2
MEENFENIVRKYYNRLREPFMRKLTRQYPSMRLDIAEDLYQDAFLAVQENLQRGKVRENTDWNAYILTIGLNMASKDMRHSGITDSFGESDAQEEEDGIGNLARKVENILKEMPEEEVSLNNDPEVLSRLGSELEHTPDPCGKIITMFYYSDASMDEIAEEVGLKNAQTAKAKKSQCMTDLIRRVTESLRRAGFDVSPKKRNRNGKN